MTAWVLIVLNVVTLFSAQLVRSTAQQLELVKVKRQVATLNSLFVGINYYYLTKCQVGPLTLATLQDSYLPQKIKSYQSKYLTDWQYQISASNGAVLAKISAKIQEKKFGDRLLSKVVPGATASIHDGRISWEKAMMGQTQTSVLANIERAAFDPVTSC